VLLGVRRRSLGHWHARGSPINEAVALPLAHNLPAARLDARRRHGRRAGRAATSGRLRTKTSSSPPSLASTKARRPVRKPLLSRPRRSRKVAAATGPGRRRRPSPTSSPLRASTGIGPQGPSPARARPAPAGGWPEFGRTAAGRPPRGHIAKGRFFSGASSQK
jgi:hypothetical protein